MVLQKPYDINLRGKTIDANEINEVTWKVSGDIQTAYKIDILSNVDYSSVWSSGKITSFALKHSIPPSSLLNGKELKIRITIYNQANASIASDSEIFQTIARPVIVVNPIGTVNSFSYNFSASYQQSQGDPLRSYIVYLYDEKKNLIDKTNIKTILPIEHLFSNLQTEKHYYIEFQATSSKGLTGTSGLIMFDVFYYRPKMNVQLDAKNIKNAGIEISWYVRQIIMKNNKGKFINNEKLDVRNGTVTADEGFTIDGDFSLKLWIESPYSSNVAEQVDLIYFSGENGTLRLQYWNDKKFHIWKEISGLKSHWASEVATGSSFSLLIQQINKDINIINCEVIA